jgi:hypothetical protein
MKTIWKFELDTAQYTEIEMPTGAEILTAHIQNEVMRLWAQVDSEAHKETRTFEAVGTGALLSDAPRKYIGTAQTAGGHYVLHVFELLL